MPTVPAAPFIQEYSYRGYLPEVKQQRAWYGSQWQWYSKYRMSAENQPDDGEARN